MHNEMLNLTRGACAFLIDCAVKKAMVAIKNLFSYCLRAG
jgi:hypothetical protein